MYNKVTERYTDSKKIYRKRYIFCLSISQKYNRSNCFMKSNNYQFFSKKNEVLSHNQRRVFNNLTTGLNLQKMVLKKYMFENVYINDKHNDDRQIRNVYS